MLKTLNRPENIQSNFWVDESIWGHRLYDEQTPWLTMLEFAGIVQSELASGRAFVEAKPNELQYTAFHRLYLRNILFNNPFVEIIKRKTINNEAQWEEWTVLMKAATGGITEPNYDYLRKRFRLFTDFAEVVRFVQASAIEGDSNKRWTSKFVFPYGPDCLYEDLAVSENKSSNDRRFFARTGELLYLMVCRSEKGPDVLQLLQSIGIVSTQAKSESNSLNKLVASLQPDDKRARVSESPPFLPYSELAEFKSLAEDWIRIGDCKMPGYDALPHLVSITGLHMVLYFISRARVILDLEAKPEIILEIVAPKKTAVREVASDSYLHNNNLSLKAIERLIDNTAKLPEWQSARLSNDSVGDCAVVLKKLFAWPKEKDDFENVNEPEALLQRLKTLAVNRHKQHLNKFHSVWSKETGLASSRGSRRTRYVPTDSLLKSLVLSTVADRMEYQEFLAVLYEKYGLIIGDRQAKEIISSGRADQSAFADNSSRLEHRLSSIGLLKRLSDACAYVENPCTAEL